MKQIKEHFINGGFVQSIGTEVQNLYNPSTAEIIGTVQLGHKNDVDAAVSAAKRAFVSFSKTSLKERAEILDRLYRSVIEREKELNELAVLEYGSPLTATMGRTRAAAVSFLTAKEAMYEVQFKKEYENAIVLQEPLGVIGAITPWNANYVHICGKIAPAIAAGCTIVIKPSEFSALQTQLLSECFLSADIPAGIINVVNGTGAVAGGALVNHPDISMVSFTGSTSTGKIIRKQSTDLMKRVNLELGGKSPNILLDDCDLSKAIPLALQIAFSNSGQACHAGSRLIVPESRIDEIKILLIQEVNKLKIGSLYDADSVVGPMVNDIQFNRVQSYIKSGIDEGAELLVGGLGYPDGLGGWYVKPTVFVNVDSNMKIAKEEIFGPVLSVIAYETEDEAVAIANDTIYGLSGYISSASLERARKLALQMVSGRVIINRAVNIEPKSPFGGFKESGIGRTGWIYGIEAHLEPKVIAF
ncbi:aldehyde dehydrogenase (NAD+) [Pedobacter sp. ok626]|uniref:aldehyde dehydrogenase family protein n=1 Tax=Pedobacter sp. ok626 TaxID=1761882 RepID=UPI00088D4156|nr:aldehyde dehydrogenase family protein [Pedobacter sp. ok626]SDL10647.1 aldehyde dehydrogenase (NAD+) [Pedobacter sp. ok626]